MDDFVTCIMAVGNLLISTTDVQEIVGVVSSSLLMIFAVIYYGIKIFNIVKDGKITEEEEKELDKIKEEIEKGDDKK